MTWFYGQWDAHLAAWHGFAREIGVKYDEKATKALDGYTAIAQSAGWWWPYKDVCIMTDRPTKIQLDSNGRLHCKNGPALEYSDGYGLWSWNGTRVSQNVIEDDPMSWSLEQVFGEANTEVRRVMIERIGWDRFVEHADLKKVGGDMPDPGNSGQTIALYDVPERIYGDVDVRVLLCTNGTVERDGTRRRFGLTVPDETTSALEAQSWMATDPDHPVPCSPEKYATLARRC